MHEPWVSRLIIEVESADGLIGLSETFGDPRLVSSIVERAPRLIGHDPFDLAGMQQLLGLSHSREANPERWTSVLPAPGTFAGSFEAKILAAFECALIDLQARILGVPVSTVLGGRVRDNVDFAAYLFYKFGAHIDAREDDSWGEVATPDDVVRLAERMVALYGFRSLKLKGGVLAPDLEIATVMALRERFPEMPLRIDPNAAWSVSTSIRVGQALTGVLEYLEDPTPGHAGMAEVARSVEVPLATNMIVTAFGDIREAVRERSASIVLADHHFWGGLRATQHLATVCETFGMGLSMHSNSHLGISFAAMAHVASTLAGQFHACDTHYPWQEADVVVERLQIVDGAVKLTDAPGLGVELDADRLAELHENHRRFGPMRRDDVGYMRRYVPDWEDARPRW
ncbi:enolase C-terminal domain-like protein [Microbacterium sp. CIAB417]|uniref:enolase C-terminal domain-like protein n=1 Tax=Microbacterium sp. CIAB417 TaxID=2860287 RepID=UPI001FABB8AE|nr:enolase C-terminal domain-like protein [Microbacterium sp. CIAB417]